MMQKAKYCGAFLHFFAFEESDNFIGFWGISGYIVGKDKVDCWGKGLKVCFKHLRILN
jgi:hypothetical protein